MWTGSFSRRFYALVDFAAAIYLTYVSFHHPWPRYLSICAFASLFALFAAGLALRVRWIWRMSLFTEWARVATNTVYLVRRLLGYPSRRRGRTIVLTLLAGLAVILELQSEDMRRDFERRPEPTDTFVCVVLAAIPLLIAASRAVLS